MTDVAHAPSSRSGEDLTRLAWWTHRSLEEEAVSPSVSAAETVMICLADITVAARARIEAWLSSDLSRSRAQIRDWQSRVQSHNADASDVVSCAREALEWAVLQPLLVSLRRALVRAWYEQRAEEVRRGADPLQVSNQTSSTPAGTASPSGSHEKRHGAEALDDRARRQLDYLEGQVHEAFLNAVVKGILQVAQSTHEEEGTWSRAEYNAIVCIALDALLTDMVLSARSPVVSKKSGDKAGWHAGLIRQLEEAAGVSATHTEQSDRRHRRLQWYICLFLRQSLRWSTNQPAEAMRQQERFPLLISTARTDVQEAVDAVCADALAAQRSEEAEAPRMDEMTTGSAATGALDVAAVGVRQEEKLCARLLHAVVDGSTGYGETAFSPHSLRAEETMSARTRVLRHVLCLTSAADLVWLREMVVTPLVRAVTASRTRPRSSRQGQQHAAAVQVAAGAETAAQTGNVSKSSPRDDLRTAVIRAMFLCHRQPSTLFLTTSFYPLIALLCEEHVTAPAAVAPVSSLGSKLPGVLQAIDVFWARSSATTRGGEPVTIDLAPTTSPEKDAAACGQTVQMNFIYACLARFSEVLSAMDTVLGDDALSSSPVASDSPCLSTSGDTSSAATLAACLAAQPLLTLNRALVWLLPKGAEMAQQGSVDLAVTIKSKASAARAQAFIEMPTPTTAPGEVPSAVRVLFSRYAAFSDVLEAALQLWQSQEEARRAGSQPVDVIAVVSAALTHAVESTFLSRGSGQLATTELLLFVVMVLTQPALEAQWQCVRRVLARFLLHASPSDKDVVPSGPHLWRAIVRRLHEWIVTQHRTGLVLFFLPALRALGLDASSSVVMADAADSHPSLCLAAGFPCSVSVAYLNELPKLFCAGASVSESGACHLAAEMAANALDWWQQVLFADVSDAKVNDDDETRTVRSETAALVMEILAEAGVVALTRADAIAASRPRACSSSAETGEWPSSSAPAVTAHNAQSVEACSAVFYAVMRLCAHVDHWSATARRALHERLVRVLISRLQDSARAAAGESEEALVEIEKHVRHFGGLRRGVPTSSRPSFTTASTPSPDQLEKVLWSAEAEVLDDAHVFAAIKSLLRRCNLVYTKYIPTKPMLTRRAELEKRAADMLAERPRVLQAIEDAVRGDVKVILAQAHTQMIEEARQQRTAEKAARAAQKAAERARRAEEAEAAVKEQQEQSKHSKENEENQKEEEGGLVTSSEAQHAEDLAAVKAPAIKEVETAEPETAADEEEEEREGEEEEEPPLVVVAPSRVRLSMAPTYFDSLLSALLARACASPSDATAASLVFLHALETIGTEDLMEPRDVVRFVLRITEALASQLPNSTTNEVASLAILFEMIGVHVVLPYKRHYMRSDATSSPSSSVDIAATATTSDKRHAISLLHALPDDERDAVRLLRCFLSDATRAITRCLAHHHALGDWSAAILHLHVRRLTGLVQATRDRIESAMMERVRTLAAAAAALTPGLEAFRHDTWGALPADLPAPALTAEHLYTQHPPKPLPAASTARSSSAVAARGATAGASTREHEGGRRGADGAASLRRKRSRSRGVTASANDADVEGPETRREEPAGLSVSQRKRRKQKERLAAAALERTDAKPVPPPPSDRKRARSRSPVKERPRRGGRSSRRGRR